MEIPVALVTCGADCMELRTRLNQRRRAGELCEVMWRRLKSESCHRLGKNTDFKWPKWPSALGKTLENLSDKLMVYRYIMVYLVTFPELE